MNIKTVIVTGSNRGIGFATVKKLAKDGARVIVACRTIKSAEETVRKISNDLDISREMLVAVKCNLIDLKSIDSMCEYVYENYGYVDALINNAAILIDKDKCLLGVNFKELKKTFETNFFGIYYLTLKILPKMIEKNYGRIVMVSSGAGQLSQLIDDMPLYRLSKFSLNGLTIMLADAAKNHNILVNACDPGWVKTDMGGAGAPRIAEQAANDIVKLAISEDVNYSGCLVCNDTIVDW